MDQWKDLGVKLREADTGLDKLRFTGLVHFFVVQLRCVYAVYFSTRDLVARAAIRLYKADTPFPFQECKAQQCTGSLGALDICLATGTRRAMFTLNTTLEDPETCTWYHGRNFLGYMHFASLLLLVAYVGRCFHLFMKNTTSHQFNTGRYLNFTNKIIENDKMLKSLTAAMIAYAFLCFGFSLYVIMFVINDDGNGIETFSVAKDFISCNLFPLLVLTLSLYGMSQNYDPVVCTDGEFQEFVFHRSFVEMLLQSNDHFLQEIENALIERDWQKNAHGYRRKPLQKIVWWYNNHVDKELFDAFWAACDPESEVNKKYYKKLGGLYHPPKYQKLPDTLVHQEGQPSNFPANLAKRTS